MKNSQGVFARIGESGCYFLCLISAGERNPNEIVDIYNACVSSGWIDENCFVYDPVRVWNYAHPENKVQRVVKSYQWCEGAAASFAVIANVHFVQVDGQKNIIFNSFDPYNSTGRPLTSFRFLYTK